MTDDLKIAFLGAGNMAGAILEGILAKGTVAPADIVAADPREERLSDLADLYGIRTTPSNAEAADGADVVLLAIKPQVFSQVMPEIRPVVKPSQLVVSIAAGVSTSTIEGALTKGCRVVRTMPNTPALVRKGATAVAPGTHATDDDVHMVRTLFGAVGEVVVIAEPLMNAVTGLSGSGPAFVFQFIEALADGGVAAGLPRQEALHLAAQTVAGAAQLVLESERHPGELKDMVTSPAGTTIAGVHALERGGFRGMVMDAVTVAAERSRQLGEKDGDG